MRAKYEFSILTDYNLIIESVSGNIAFEDYFNLKQKEFNDKNFDPNYNVLIDFRHVEFNVEPKEIKNKIKHVVSTILKMPDSFGKRKSAFIATTPNQVAILTMYIRTGNIPVSSEIFSTVEAALDWLDVPVSFPREIVDAANKES